MRKFLSVLMSVFILVGCGSSSVSDVVEEVKDVVQPIVEDIVAPEPTQPQLPVVPTVDTVVEPIAEVPVVPTVDTVVEPIAEVPVVEPIADTIEKIVEPIVCKEFIPFDHIFNMPYYTEDYEAIANQDIVHIGDCVTYEGNTYTSLRNHNTMPDAFNTNGNPFHVITDQAFNGGVYTRQKVNELTCTEEVTLSRLDDIDDLGIWTKDWYTMTAHGTDNCKSPELEYSDVGQLSTSLYGAVALGAWKFRLNDVMYTGYKRDYVIIPTPGSAEDLNFWEIQSQ